jgi:hypothetical protein
MTTMEKVLIIREIEQAEYSFLKEMLYQAIFLADDKITLLETRNKSDVLEITRFYVLVHLQRMDIWILCFLTKISSY